MSPILRVGADAFVNRSADILSAIDSRDDGHAISYKALRRGTVVRSSDDVEVGTVRRVLDNARENIFDGLVLETKQGMRFVDAPEVRHIAERAVTLTITAAEVAELPPPRSLMRERWDQATIVRRARRAGRDWKRRWDNR
jgi:hypothetical protein